MTDVSEVKGVGPKTSDKLKSGGFESAEKLAKATLDDIINLGIGKATASKIIKNAAEVSSTEEKAFEVVVPETSADVVSKEPSVEKPKKSVEKKVKKEVSEEPAKEEKPKKVSPKKKKKSVAPPPEDEIFLSKKKKGVQVTKVTDKDLKDVKTVDEDTKSERETWKVTARKLSKEEKEARAIRREQRKKADQITREIPTAPQAVKAKRTGKREKGVKPIKKERVSKEAIIQPKKKKAVVEVYTNDDLLHVEHSVRARGLKGKKTESKPRSIVGTGTVIGQSSSYRRSKRVIHPNTLIVKLSNGYSPEELIGKKVKLTYPDTNSVIKGSVVRTFGKRSSAKVLVRFDKGVRTSGIYQPIVIA